MDQKEEKKGRAEMPLTAEMVDQLREMLGVERVNAAIQAGVRAEREFRAIEAAKGLAEAQRWLRAQKFPAGAFMAVEGDKRVGILPDRVPVGLMGKRGANNAR